MARSVLIVGSGPAAAGAALAISQRSGVEITVLDIGTKLEHGNEQARSRLSALSAEDWNPDDLDLVSRLPVGSDVSGLPEKRSFGSDFPFRNAGQRDRLVARGEVNGAVISSAYGGFSNVWGAQITPFTAAAFEDWPVAAEEMSRHYERVLREIPYAAEDDDLSEFFPLFVPSAPLPPVSERTALVLDRYARHRGRLNRQGVVVGRARLAFRASDCVRCGLCMTGCPYALIYSASQTLDKLRRNGRITYRDGMLATAVEEQNDQATVTAKHLSTGRYQRFTADHVFLACGAIGTAQLVMGSLGLFDIPARVQESRQFVLPFVSRPTQTDPREADDFTLNQFNMVISLDAVGHDVSQLHFYTYNPAFSEALPRVLTGSRSRALHAQILHRLSVAIGYLPSWRAPGFTIQVNAPNNSGELPAVTLSSSDARFFINRMLCSVLARLIRSAPALDLWPVLPMLSVPAPGKSYHWGGVFPHTKNPVSRFSSDTLGRVVPWRRVHLVDASVFPSIPATTFTLTIMANAHRIASETMELAA